VAAAKINIAAFTKAKFNAIVESIKLYFKACFIPSVVYQIFWFAPKKNADIKCGITVAPMIPYKYIMLFH
jgi:hypothetical protein